MISSFCTIATYTCFKELIGWLLSLSIHHTNERVYCMVDSKTKSEIDKISPKIKLDIIWFIDLNKYTGLNRSQMESKHIWSEFQMMKAEVIRKSLEQSSNTLFLDSDILITGRMSVDNNYELAVSPHYISRKSTDRYGYYNGGMLWTRMKCLPDKWIKYTKTSRFHDQASIEDLVKDYKYYEFGENYNFSWWRLEQSDESESKIANYLKVNENKITYKEKELKFIHTHFDRKNFSNFNNLMINTLMKARRFKELLCIRRMLDNKWTIQIPTQPRNGKYNHINDSFRELVYLFKGDVCVENINNNHCWIKGGVVLYDRPTLLWYEKELDNVPKILMGNGSKEEINKINASPWIFWARKPKILEEFLNNNKLLSWNERNIKSIFIGNIECSQQKKHRNNNWNDVIEKFILTQGNKHKYSHKEYLTEISKAQFGLCLAGYGLKCHREIELMALGTVPIIYNSSIEYMNKLIENVHYIKINSKEELITKLENIKEEQWEFMSNECNKWYMKNCHSSSAFTETLNKLLYYI